MTLASIEEPPYLTVGTDVSAKYKGAFCEAKITDVNKHVKLRVLFDGGTGTHLIDDTDLKAGSTIETGTKIEAKHPEKKQLTYVQATITKVLDHSRYTVVFDDGDQCVLRRNSICLKSGKHFAESETLDQLPLTNPEHFGNPVKVGAAESQANNSLATPNSGPTNNKSHANNNHHLDEKPPKSKSLTNATGENSKSNAIASGENNNIRKRQVQQQDSGNEIGVRKLKKERAASNQANNSTTTAISTPANNSTTATNTPGRRGLKGRKRRESLNNGPKQVDQDETSVEDSADSSDMNPAESTIKFDTIEIGVKLMVQYGKGRAQNVYEAKVNKIETNSSGKTRYFVHYTGWNNRYDEWITNNRILSIVTEKEVATRDGRSRQSEAASAGSTAQPAQLTAQANNSTASASNSKDATTTSSSSSNVKEKEKETSTKTRRSDFSNVASEDVDQSIMRRNSINLKGSKNNIDLDAQDQVQSTNPEQSANSSRAGTAEAHVNTSLGTQSIGSTTTKSQVSNNHQVDEKPPKGKSSSNSSASDNSRQSSIASETNNIRKRQLQQQDNGSELSFKKLKKERNVVQQTNSAPTAAPTPVAPTSAPATTASTPGRRGLKGRKRRESLSNGPKQIDICETPTTQDGADTADEYRNSCVKLISTEPGVKVVSQDVRGKLQTAHETRVNKIETNSRNRVASIVQTRETPTKDDRSKQPESVATNSTDQSTAQASNNNTSVHSSADSSTTSPTCSGQKNEEKETTTKTKHEPSNLTNSIITSEVSQASKPVAPVNDPTVLAETSLATTSSTTTTPASTASTSSSRSSSSGRQTYRFCEEIDELDCDKKISILQERIMALRQAYISLKSELADLDRKKKRPRTETSSAEHVNSSCALTCRN